MGRNEAEGGREAHLAQKAAVGGCGEDLQLQLHPPETSSRQTNEIDLESSKTCVVRSPFHQFCFSPESLHDSFDGFCEQKVLDPRANPMGTHGPDRSVSRPLSLTYTQLRLNPCEFRQQPVNLGPPTPADAGPGV